jgi:cathepsin B
MSAADMRGLLGAIISQEDSWDLQAEEKNTSFRQEHRAALQQLGLQQEEEFDARERWPQCAETMGHVRDQGQCGDCWAMAAASVIETRLCIASNGTFSGPSAYISGGFIASCGNNAKDGCTGGMVRTALKWAAQHGVPTGGRGSSSNTCVPYFASGNSLDHFFAASHQAPPCPSACTNGLYPRELGTDKFVPEGMFNTLTSKDFDVAKKVLSTHGPIAMGFRTYSDFMSYKSGVYRPGNDTQFMGLHATTAIGFGPDYILGVNSWDTNWGEEGLFKLHHSVVLAYWLPGMVIGIGAGYSYPLPDGPLEPFQAKCLQKDTKYIPQESSDFSVEWSVLRCQQRCANTPGCETFSFYHDGVHDGHCYLQGAGAHRIGFADVTSGPAVCEEGTIEEEVITTTASSEPDDACWRPVSQCVETFSYEGVTYSGCTTKETDIHSAGWGWCSHHASYANEWSYCMWNCRPVRTTTPKDGDCWVPPDTCAKNFSYKNVIYTGCTTADYGTQGWCSHTSVHQVNGWSECTWDCTATASSQGGRPN